MTAVKAPSRGDRDKAGCELEACVTAGMIMQCVAYVAIHARSRYHRPQPATIARGKGRFVPVGDSRVHYQRLGTTGATPHMTPPGHMRGVASGTVAPVRDHGRCHEM